MSIATVTPAQLSEIANENPNVELIDVRMPFEYRAVRVPFARNFPMLKLEPEAIVRNRPEALADQPIYFICHSGTRSRMVCEKFVKAGYPNVVNVEGGTATWTKLGLPVIRESRAISLERQVRIVAGALVLTGATLGWFVHPAWIGLSAFVGAGLIFAGITDKCGMALLLGQMPWNLGSGSKDGDGECAASS